MRQLSFFIVLLFTVLSAKAQQTVALGDTTYQHKTDSLMQIADYEFFYGGNFNKAHKLYVEAYTLGSTNAAYWYESAAQHGLKEAQIALANMLLTGDGIEKDEKKGSVWLKISQKNK